MARIEKKNLPEKVIDEIRHRLDTGQLKLGEKLPNQNELSFELGVSRTSLREAMRMLDLLGVIEQRPGYGTVIRKTIPRLHEQTAEMMLLSDANATFEFLEARLIIECGAVRLAAEKITDDDLKTLLQYVEEMDRLLQIEDYTRYKTIDYAFHDLITKVGGNRFLQKASVELEMYTQKFIDENTMLLPGLLKKSQKHHWSIYKAVAARDPGRAEREVRRHIETIVESYKRYRTSKENED